MLKEYSKFLFFYLLFWLLVFNFSRLIFIGYYFDTVSNVGIGHLLTMPIHAFMLDLSMVCYILVLPLLLFAIQLLIQKQFFYVVLKWYTALLLIIFTMITAAELNLYAEWQTKVDYRALVYLKQPSEVFKTATAAQTVIFFLYLVAIVWLEMKLYSFLIRKKSIQFTGTLFKKSIVALLLFVIGSPLLLLGLRGGFQMFPINQSWAYYSNNNTINLASVNSMWNVMGSVFQNMGTLNNNPYNVMPLQEAKDIVNTLNKVEKDTTISFLTTNEPNIVLLILESFSADLVQSCGGDTGITPQLEKLIQKGYLFDQIYASGTLSHQGMASIFSGFPAQPTTSIIKEQAKFSKLPSINAELLKKKYNTSFYFGGQLTFANIKSYLYFNKFDKIKDFDDYESGLPTGKLGLHDEYTLRDHLKELNTKPQPFFSALFTQSTHSPYDIPIKWTIEKGGSERDFLNAAWYSDSCIGAYITECKKQAWYKNTLFIVIADHSKHTHYDRNYFEPLNRHIPLLFFGEVIKPEFQGKINSVLGSQNDFAATLLNQLKLNAKPFTWSKNLMNPYSPQYAYYALTSGFGWYVPNKWLTYNYQSQNNDFNTCSNQAMTDSLNKCGKAYLQVLFQQYLDY